MEKTEKLASTIFKGVDNFHFLFFFLTITHFRFSNLSFYITFSTNGDRLKETGWSWTIELQAANNPIEKRHISCSLSYLSLSSQLCMGLSSADSPHLHHSRDFTQRNYKSDGNHCSTLIFL